MLVSEFVKLHGFTIESQQTALRENEKGFRYIVKIGLAGEAPPERKLCPRSVTVDYIKSSAYVGYKTYENKDYKELVWKMLSFEEMKQWEKGHRYNGRLMNARPIPPQLNEVMQCIWSDCHCIESSPLWEDFANELGYNVDSIKDKQVFEACSKQYFLFRSMLGYKLFSEFMKCEPE